MYRHLMFLGAVLCAALPSSLQAQDADLKSVLDRIDAMEQRLQASMEKRFADVESKQDTLTTEIQKNSEQIDQLKQDFTAVQRDYSDLLERLDQVTEQSSSGEWNLKVLGNMQTRPEFRQQMAVAVNESIAPQGRIIVTNFMDTWQRIVVNGQDRWIAPSAGREEVFTVPVGTVTTVIPGYEGQRNWTLTAPKYTQRIDIVPRHTSLYAPAENNNVQTVNYAPAPTYSAPTTAYYAPTTTYYAASAPVVNVPTYTATSSYYVDPWTGWVIAP